MKRITFVCLGNICRSPMAELIMKDIVKKRGLENEFIINSKGTSSEELGNPVYYATEPIYKRLNIDYSKKRAEKLRKSDYFESDLFVGMDFQNIAQMERIFGGDPDNKICLIMDYTSRGGEVSDPWWTRDFEKAYQDILEGVNGLLEYLLKN
ncbi:MAG: low molecular weight phosphotyrosine protein phosphatase [Clostridia bacterium]|nr:low molecular weight phosphotyrosine protein phosphatase [Clostridia bacterium]